MKKIHIIPLLVLFVLFGFNTAGITQNVVQGEIFAEIIPALTATEVAQLNFGRFSPTTQGGQVLITPDGVRMATGTIVLAEGLHQPARFYITGEANTSYSVTFPTGSTTLVNTTNAKTIQVSKFVSSTTAGSKTGLLEGGAQEVKVGATLTVGPPEDNPVGLYTGTYIIRFDYN